MAPLTFITLWTLIAGLRALRTATVATKRNSNVALSVAGMSPGGEPVRTFWSAGFL